LKKIEEDWRRLKEIEKHWKGLKRIEEDWRGLKKIEEDWRGLKRKTIENHEMFNPSRLTNGHKYQMNAQISQPSNKT
jgi:hypothetical protein